MGRRNARNALGDGIKVHVTTRPDHRITRSYITVSQASTSRSGQSARAAPPTASTTRCGQGRLVNIGSRWPSALSLRCLYAQGKHVRGARKMPMTVFSYQIVSAGGYKGQAVLTGNLYIAGVESAKLYVQTVPAPNLADLSDLEVILLDHMGPEICRGPYLGPQNP